MSHRGYWVSCSHPSLCFSFSTFHSLTHSLTHTSPAGLILLLHISESMYSMFTLSFSLSLECSPRLSTWFTLLTPQLPATMLPSHCFPQFPSSKVGPNPYSQWSLSCFLFLQSTSHILCIFPTHFVYCLSLLRECGLLRVGISLSSTCHMFTQNSAWHKVGVQN